ncbi:MAG: hypothetical protein V2I31_14650 [Mariniphaga sp.]|jgi:hypothetical protein|nr:hypothetical protein [Mariniphaga sp.]
MIKHFLSAILVFFLALSVKAQNTTFNEGDKVLNLGLGLGSTLYTGSFYSTSVPPVSGSFEVGIKDELFDENSSLGVGGYLGYSSSNYSGWGSNYGFSNFIIGGRGSLHYQFIDKLDTYGGLMLGFRVVSWKSSSGNFDYGSVAGSGIATAFYVGGRYYFTDNLAGMVELGYGIAYLNIGLALKF